MTERNVSLNDQFLGVDQSSLWMAPRPSLKAKYQVCMQSAREWGAFKVTFGFVVSAICAVWVGYMNTNQSALPFLLVAAVAISLASFYLSGTMGAGMARLTPAGAEDVEEIHQWMVSYPAIAELMSLNYQAGYFVTLYAYNALNKWVEKTKFIEAQAGLAQAADDLRSKAQVAQCTTSRGQDA